MEVEVEEKEEEEEGPSPPPKMDAAALLRLASPLAVEDGVSEPLRPCVSSWRHTTR